MTVPVTGFRKLWVRDLFGKYGAKSIDEAYELCAHQLSKETIGACLIKIHAEDAQKAWERR